MKVIQVILSMAMVSICVVHLYLGNNSAAIGWGLASFLYIINNQK